jgi:CheY-like chemotaxis protein
MNRPAALQFPGPDAAAGRVLVVDDDPEAAEYFRHVLTRRGRFEVTHTADPVAALALAASQPWDLLLTDLDLPGMSGLALLAALRPLLPRLPFVLATAHAPAGELLDLSRPRLSPYWEADAVLVKPVPADVLLATVTRLTANCNPKDGAGTGVNSPQWENVET